MEYFIMALGIIFATTNSLVLKLFNNKTIKNTGDTFFFNGAVSIVWVVVMLIWFIASGDTTISITAVIYGLIYGVILCLFLFLKMQALHEGPVSITTLISSAAFVPATIFGIFYANEKASLLQIFGMVVMLIALFMCVNPKKSEEKLTVKWFIYTFAFFLAGGLLGMFYKVFGKSSASNEVNGMMLSASVFSAVLFFVVGLIINKVKKEPLPTIKKPSLLYIIGSAVFGCAYIRINLSLSAIIPSAIFFPVANGSLVILSTFLGYLLFKEKLSKLQWFGMVVGLIAIVMSGLGNI